MAPAAAMLRAQQTVRFVRFVSTLPPQVKKFVDKYTALCTPKDVHVCDGSKAEAKKLIDGLIAKGTMTPLNSSRPNSYLAWTSPEDVARSEKDTFICSNNYADAGPTNNWCKPSEKKQQLEGLLKGAMAGRTLYVVPFSMGPLSSPFSKIGIQLTDSAYVALSMGVMTRMGSSALAAAGNGFVECVHSVGVPLANGEKDTFWPCNIKNRSVCHFPETNEIISFGSGYGGNSLLGKKCFALRIGSTLGRREGWLAEHMLILGITNPAGKKKYFAAAFPSACGKTNLAMLSSSLPGWKVETVGDDIAWIRMGKDGRLRAMNPEFGFFGVAPGTSLDTNASAMATIQSNTIFTNVGLTEDNDVYWNGLPKPKGTKVLSWTKKWRNLSDLDESKDPVAQSNSRFAAPVSQCPVLDPNWESPDGVPLDAIIFGGRRRDTMPLVFQTYNWQHGVFIGSVMRSEATSASDQVGLVNDPMAMKAFCGYNVKDYFQHWLDVGAKCSTTPGIFHVNWFRRNDKNKFIWPGFGENVRVLKWIFERTDQQSSSATGAKQSAIGWVPTEQSLDVSGLKVQSKELSDILTVKKDAMQKELADAKKYYTEFLGKEAPAVPPTLKKELDLFAERVSKM